MKDMHNHLDPQQSLISAVRTATADGVTVDLQGFEGAMFSVDLGTMGGSSSPTETFKFQESDASGSGFADVAVGDLGSGAQPAAITTANDNTIIKDSYLGAKRYVRIIISAVGGTSPSLPCAGSIVRGFGRHQPI